MRHTRVFFLFLLLSLLPLAFPYPAHAALQPIEITTIDPQATGYGTFQSHNQKVISNTYGIFTSSLHSRNVVFGNNTWWLSRSTDGGKTFSTVYQGANTLHTPPIETDPNGNIYAIVTNTDGGDATLLRFEPKINYSNPTTLATLPSGSAQKNVMILDWSRQQIYYVANHDYNAFVSHDFRFYIVGLDGQIKKNIILTQAGPLAYAHYPHLYMDESNTLYLAWTTTDLAATVYWDIHFMLSKDGGQSWEKPDGTKLPIPVIADETGPTDHIVPDNEHSVNTWLWNMTVKNGKIHFPYAATGTQWVQHYVRYDLETAKIDINVTPKWQGERVYFNNTDGFCATKKDIPDYPIYCVSRNGDWRFGVLVSYDNGTTWHDYAQSDFNDKNIYAIGGSREITSDGYIIGTYTDQTSDPKIVRFFRVKVTDTAVPTPTPTPPSSDITSYWSMDETSGDTVADAIGSHHGITTAPVIDGKLGKARRFGTAKLFIPSFSANFDSDGAFAVEAWIKKDSSTKNGEHRIIGNRYKWDDSNGWYLVFPTNESIDFSIQSATNPSVNLYSTAPLEVGTWYHIAGVYDHGTVKLYVNGELNQTKSSSYSPSNRELTIGSQPDSSNYYFDGIIDEVRLYSSALSAETIRQHFLGFIPADINRDGKVDMSDHTILIADFGKTGAAGFSPSDIDKNGTVDIFDYNTFVENFGK